ncbi:hypothetical protein MNBD_ALPHA12-1535 [hydrothermal vent metagenome]|uniref:Uncharacterized protein n=1 Tax=hydrothermal vent metagenome TaxID=652676 RepID=A0A3B0U456_9ZZZZ
MEAANVHPDTRLATDFLNPFNEYIMLGEMVGDKTMTPDVLADWLPIDYETHFARSGFVGMDIVLAAFRSLPCYKRKAFEDAVNILIELILDHQILANQIFADNVFTHQSSLEHINDHMSDIKHARDKVSALISDPSHFADVDNNATQAAIDALFD